MRRGAIVAGLALLTVACGDGGAPKVSGPNQVTNAQNPKGVQGRIDCSPKGTVGYAQLDFKDVDGHTVGNFSVYCTKNDPLAPPIHDTTGWVKATPPASAVGYSVTFSLYEGFVDQSHYIQHESCFALILNALTGTLSCSGATTLSATVTVK